MDSLPLLQQVKAYHKEAFEYISTALLIDEEKNGNKEEATAWYKKGIIVLEKGTNVNTMGASPGDKEKIIRLQAKMMKNLEMAKDRIKDLASGEADAKKNSCPKPNNVRNNSKSNSKPPSNLSFSASKTFKPNTPPKIPPMTHFLRAKRPSSSNKVSTNIPETSRSVAPPKTSSRRLKSVPSDLAKRIMDTALEAGEKNVKFEDVAGQEMAKEALHEMVILPTLRPDLFSGLRSPAKGLLLFGPPGNGKTLLAKAVACEAKSVFFNISAATLTSKWVGEGEKMVKALFAVAREVQPSIIFIDEIDSLLRARQENENDSARRLQTEFFLQFDGVGSDPNDRILVMGATNRPHELDDAALRRFPKRIYVRLPDVETRVDLFNILLARLDHSLNKSQIKDLSKACQNYSFSDLTDLVKDSAMGPIREIPKDLFTTIDASKMRKVNANDFQNSLKKIRPSVSLDLLRVYEEWNKKHGDVTGM